MKFSIWAPFDVDAQILAIIMIALKLNYGLKDDSSALDLESPLGSFIRFPKQILLHQADNLT